MLSLPVSEWADWGSGDWASALFDLGDIINEDEKDDLWGENRLDLLFGGIGDKVNVAISCEEIANA